LGVHTGRGFMKRHLDCWFVLTTESLSWYRDEEEKDKKYTIQLDRLKIRDIESSIISRKQHLFALISADGHDIFKKYRQLDLSCDSQEEVENWKASFLRAGVYPEKEVKLPTENDEISMSDQQVILERSVETIRNLVDSYMKIVTKSTRDFVPKIIIHMIINNLKDFIKHEIIAQICLIGDRAALMEESAEETQRLNDLLKMYNSSREALRIIDEIARDSMNNFTSSDFKLYPNIGPLKSTRPAFNLNTNVMKMLKPIVLSDINQQQQHLIFKTSARVPNQQPLVIFKRASATSTYSFKPSSISRFLKTIRVF
jgi:hypothetical protein